MPSLAFRSNTLARVILLFAFFLLVYLLGWIGSGKGYKSVQEAIAGHGRKISSTSTVEQGRNSTTTWSVKDLLPCQNLPGAEDILLTIKTGATEIYNKLPAHFLTTFQCAPTIFIVSDLEQKVGAHHVHDVLTGVSNFVREKNKDFELYRQQKQYSKELQDIQQLTGGWDLDKWKFLPMMHQAYQQYSDKKWYLFMEADTYWSWNNILTWLQKLDHTRPLYLGSEVFIGDTRFAHGGSGIVLSQAAMKKLHEIESLHKSDWEAKIPGNCCGDAALADALLDAGVRLTAAGPGIQGERPSTLGFSRDNWCVPVMTWHHVTSAEVDALWQFDQRWLGANGPDVPILFADYFANFVEPYLRPMRTDWDNLSTDWVYTGKEVINEADVQVFQEAHKSGSGCQQACIAKERCFQWSYQPGTCTLHGVVKLGKPDHKKEKNIISGWMMERIRQLKDELEPCDPDKGWVVPRG